MEANLPPQRPPALPAPRPLGLSAVGNPVVTTAVPPLYANSFDVVTGEYDFTVKFQQVDPYLADLGQQDSVAGQQAQIAMTQQPAAVVTLSPQAMEALWEKMGEALGKTPAAAEKPEK